MEEAAKGESQQAQSSVGGEERKFLPFVTVAHRLGLSRVNISKLSLNDDGNVDSLFYDFLINFA
jgi:hypothetical protein